MENQENQENDLGFEDAIALLKEQRNLSAIERKKAKEYETLLKEMKAREESLNQDNVRMKSQLWELLNKESDSPANPLKTDSHTQSESVRELLSRKDMTIEEKDNLIKEKERAIEAKEIERAIYSIYFSCGGIPDSDERNSGITDLRLLPSKVIHSRIAPIIAKRDGQLVILGEDGEIEYNPEGGKKTIGDKIRELKDTESLSRFFLNRSSANKAPQSISPSRGKFVARELAKQGKADIDAIASGRISVR